MGSSPVRLPRHGAPMRLTPTAIAGLNEVLLQCALRAERNKAGRRDPAADARAAEIARRWDERAAEARTQ